MNIEGCIKGKRVRINLGDGGGYHYARIDSVQDGLLGGEKVHFDDYHLKKTGTIADYGACNALCQIRSYIETLQQEQPANMIQWTGNNLKEVIDFTGKSPKFGEWFKSWEEYENYVHTHNDILKLFCEDGSHFEVPVGAWIVKTPDGYNVPSVARFIHAKKEQPEVDLEKEIIRFLSNSAKMNKGEWRGKYAISEIGFRAVAHHFYELGLNARKED